MLQKLRDQTQSTGFKILVGAIIVVLTLFGFGATNLFMGADPEIAQVGDFEITQTVLEAETERERRRVLSQMGPEFDPSSIDRLQLQQYVLQQLISRQVLYQTAESLGVRVTPEQVNEQLINSPAYQVDGQFNEAIYRQQVQALGYTPVSFVEEFTNALSAEQLRTGIESTTLLTDWELGELIRVINQRRDVAYLPLTVEQFRDKVNVTDDEVTLRYNENQSAYMTELLVDVSYVYLSAEQLAAQSDVEVTEDELLSLYAEERAAALADEQRDSAHILIQVNEDRSADQALALINEVQDRLAAGESFADLAAELSEDPGSADNGGDLGAVGKGIFDPAFEQALWALQEEGEISEPVLSSFGYHLIRLNGIVTPEYPSFDEQRAALEQQIRRLKGEERFVDAALELERDAYDERFALSDTAGALGVEVRTASKVGRHAEAPDDILSRPEVLDVLFSREVLEGVNSDAIELGDSEVVVVRVDEQYPPEPIALEEVADDIRETLIREKAMAEITLASESGLARLQAGESVTEVANSLGSKWQSFPLLTRVGGNQDLPQTVRARAFELPRPAAGGKSVDAVDIPGGAALITVTRVVQGNMNTTTDAEVEQIRQLTAGRVGRNDLQGFFSAAEQRLDVTRPTG